MLKIQRDEISLKEEGIDVVICTTDLLQQLLLIKDIVPVFPSKKLSKYSFMPSRRILTKFMGVVALRYGVDNRVPQLPQTFDYIMSYLVDV